MRQYDTVTILIGLDIPEPFTVVEAIEHMGTNLGFDSLHIPTIWELRTILPRDSRIECVGERCKQALYQVKK